MPTSISAKSMMLIGFLLVAAPSLAQKKDRQTWAVYVVTVQGECRSGMSFMKLVYPLHYNTLPDQAALIKPGQHLGAGSSYSNVVYLNSEINSAEASKQAVGYLQALAQSSGGRYYEVTDLADTRRSFVNVAEELRRYYWLGYYPDNTRRDGSFRKIRIVVGRPDAVVRARGGYRVPNDTLTSPQEPTAQPKLNNTKP